MGGNIKATNHASFLPQELLSNHNQKYHIVTQRVAVASQPMMTKGARTIKANEVLLLKSALMAVERIRMTTRIQITESVEIAQKV
jgi:hypothetical protein